MVLPLMPVFNAARFGVSSGVLRSKVSTNDEVVCPWKHEVLDHCQGSILADRTLAVPPPNLEQNPVPSWELLPMDLGTVGLPTSSTAQSYSPGMT